MKINKKETYSIDDLTKEELLFFFEVIEKMSLSSDSSPEAFSVAKKFKEFRKELIEPSQTLTCDGCETTTTAVKEQLCPLEKEVRNLCSACLSQREQYAKQIENK